MKINFCCPTRNKVGQIGDFVSETLRNATSPDVRVVVGFDRDDDTMVEAIRELPQNDGRLIISTEDREDSLGAKYNRCAEAYPADIYIQGLDDVSISTPGWDRRLADIVKSIPDGMAQVWMGKEPAGEPWPSFIAVTQDWVNKVGFFCPPYFPFWWCNTWIEELGQLTGRIFRTDIVTRYPKKIADFKVPPRKGVAYWATFFDRTRTMRLEQAARIMSVCQDPRWRKEQLFNQWPDMAAYLEQRNSFLRDPQTAAQFEGVAETDTSRHDRLRERAEAILKEI